MKSIILASMMTFSALTAPLAIAAVPASVTITCPVTSGDAVNQLRNFANSFIAGNGNESISMNGGPPASSFVAFKGSAPLGTPGSLATYSVLTVSFNGDDAGNPFVNCTYSSSNLAFPNISVSYALLNGFGAEELSSDATSVTLSIPIGFKA